ncbi:hypothetical protein BV20DRAFT_945981 [Pilatotrama ljubarskyi]|nr:hypothetical protein BV20DRAFT_945981 [Pilatotrama ljubarskyi]
MNHQHTNRYYCAPCDRTFTSPGNLDSHHRSSQHQAKTVACPAVAGGRACGKHFVSLAALFLHLEFGACPSGLALADVVPVALRIDEENLLTEPGARLRHLKAGSRLGRGADLVELAVQLALGWGGPPYRCVYCPKTHRSASALRQHLCSAGAHAPRVFRCPPHAEGCGARFRTLGALCQHVESGWCKGCGVGRRRGDVSVVVREVVREIERVRE